MLSLEPIKFTAYKIKRYQIKVLRTVKYDNQGNNSGKLYYNTTLPLCLNLDVKNILKQAKFTKNTKYKCRVTSKKQHSSIQMTPFPHYCIF